MSEIKYRRVMLKVSGEALAGPAHRGLDFDVINSVCAAIKEKKTCRCGKSFSISYPHLE